jgi:ribosomal protein L29
MGVELSVYRATVGLHNAIRVLKCSVTSVSATELHKCTFIYGLIIAILLIAAGIESNPGPITEETLTEFAREVRDIISERFASERCEYKKDLSIMRYQLATQEIQNKRNFDEVIKKLEIARKENEILKRKINELERAQRKNNVIIFGESEMSPTEECVKTVLKMCKSMDMDVTKGEIKDAYRLGKKKGKRPLLCKFANFRTKQDFMSKCKQNNDITALHDLSKEDRINLKKLKPHMDRARQNGHRAVVREGKLVINSVTIPKEHIFNEENNSGNAAPTTPKHPATAVPTYNNSRRESVSPTPESDRNHVQVSPRRSTRSHPPIPLPRQKHLKILQHPDEEGSELPRPPYNPTHRHEIQTNVAANVPAASSVKNQQVNKPKICTAVIRPPTIPPPIPSNSKSCNNYNIDEYFYHGVHHAPFPVEEHITDNSDTDTDEMDFDLDNEKYLNWLHNNIENL